MNPVHILQMLQRLERVFNRETARVDVNSQIMLNSIADRRAEKNFHFIMAAIKQESMKKAWKQRMKDQLEEEAKNQSASGNSQMLGATAGSGSPIKSPAAAAPNTSQPVNMEHLNITEDYLVTYREFM